MNITPIANYFQTRKINQQKYTANNINFGMAKLDQVQLSKSKDDYFQKAREDYIGYFWASHPEDDIYIPKLGSAEADKEYFLKNFCFAEMKTVMNAKKYGVNKNQTFYQAANLEGYYGLKLDDRILILRGIYELPDLENGEQRKTVLSELAQSDISEFKSFISYEMCGRNPEMWERILRADTFLWDTLDNEGKRFVLRYVSKEVEQKLVAQEMEKLSEIASDEIQSSILTSYVRNDGLGRAEILKLISDIDKETLISWMKKDNVFVKKLDARNVMQLVKIIGVDEFDKLYSAKYGRLFDTFFDNPASKKTAIECFGVDNYKEQYEQKYGDWEKIKYDSYLYKAKNAEYGTSISEILASSDFKELNLEYQVDFIIRVLNYGIEVRSHGLQTEINNPNIQNFVESYAIDNENVSLEDSIKILEGLLKFYTSKAEHLEANGNLDKASVYRDKIIKTKIALQALNTQME